MLLKFMTKKRDKNESKVHLKDIREKREIQVRQNSQQVHQKNIFSTCQTCHIHNISCREMAHVCSSVSSDLWVIFWRNDGRYATLQNFFRAYFSRINLSPLVVISLYRSSNSIAHLYI